ncbi:MAG: ornithine carbamoyltransferase, partial [Coriobacteriia bacterium]|nr:ornithine carbamoyltransferase [Coriobacteriia bacterium]
HPVIMSGAESAFSRDESVFDTAHVMERYVDAVVIRTFEQSLLEQFAEAASVPVINALSDEFHPCQVLADLLTIEEHLGRLEEVAFAYVGDGNNMAHSYLLGGALAGMRVRLACPDGFGPKEEVVEHAHGIAAATGASVDVLDDPGEAVAEADVVATDTWASMGFEAEHDSRLEAFAGFTVDAQLMKRARPGALFMHCLPAHRGEEVLDEVIDADYSIVFDEAENRLHAQKALLSLVLGVSG